MSKELEVYGVDRQISILVFGSIKARMAAQYLADFLQGRPDKSYGPERATPWKKKLSSRIDDEVWYRDLRPHLSTLYQLRESSTKEPSPEASPEESTV